MNQRTLIAYSITFCLVFIIYFAINAAVKSVVADAKSANLLSVALALLIYTPLQSLVVNSINRVINKKHLFLQSQLLQLKEEVKYITHLLRLQRVLVRRIAELFRIQVASLFILNEASNIYELSDGLGITQKDKRKIQFKSSGGLLVWLRMEKRALYFPQLKDNKRYQYLGKEEKEKTKKLQAELCIPLILGEKIIGVLFLGAKPNKKLYTDEEIEMLQQVANQAAQAIMNATAQRDLTSTNREITRYQNRIRLLENRLSESQKSYQNLLDYLKTGIIVMKLGDNIVKLNEEFKEEMLPDLSDRFKNFLNNSISREVKVD